jgi:hypothetical protein
MSAQSEPQEEVIPILRVEDACTTARWYERLGFELINVHRFDPGLPAFATIQRGDISLFLSEHTGDARPTRRSTCAYGMPSSWQRTSAYLPRTIPGDGTSRSPILMATGCESALPAGGDAWIGRPKLPCGNPAHPLALCAKTLPINVSAWGSLGRSWSLSEVRAFLILSGRG